MRIMVGIVALVMVLGACGGDDDGVLDPFAGEPECPAIGEPMADQSCRVGNDYYLVGIWDCDDGRRFARGDFGEGFVGEPMIEPDPDAVLFWAECQP